MEQLGLPYDSLNITWAILGESPYQGNCWHLKYLAKNIYLTERDTSYGTQGYIARQQGPYTWRLVLAV